MEFGLLRAIRLASSSLAARRPAHELVADRRPDANRSATRFDPSEHRDSSNLYAMLETRSATSSRAGRRPASELDSACDRPNSITLSSSLATR